VFIVLFNTHTAKWHSKKKFFFDLWEHCKADALITFGSFEDIDVVPNVGLRKQFIDFAQRNGLFDATSDDKTAYVLPAFEVLKGFEFPEEKRQLLLGVGECGVSAAY